ncbi:uncharacterized protein LOC129592374 [Paramacrobiotus metropolitanus]|uniref:uncharacterized protein LOC129592374 n=1 Tax=Paramacrobiotus metropolitanus TaxID=2943436 RepID=UPI00244626EA|nr:uncharacterized protein LOC129592374 [Paramacrobiotus metropolitanus]
MGTPPQNMDNYTAEFGRIRRQEDKQVDIAADSEKRIRAQEQNLRSSGISAPTTQAVIDEEIRLARLDALAQKRSEYLHEINEVKKRLATLDPTKEYYPETVLGNTGLIEHWTKKLTEKEDEIRALQPTTTQPAVVPKSQPPPMMTWSATPSSLPPAEEKPSPSRKVMGAKALFTPGIHKKLVGQAKTLDLQRILYEAQLQGGIRDRTMTDEQQTQTAQKIHATIQDRDKVLRRLVTLRCGKQELRQLPLDSNMIQTIQRLRNPSINPGAYTLEIQPRPGEEVTEKIPITMSDSSEDEENADDVDSDDSIQRKAATPPKGSTPKRGRSPSRPKALQAAMPTRHKVTASEPKSTKKTAQQSVKMKVPPPTRQPSVQINDDLDTRVINSANSAKSHKDKRKAKKEAAKQPAKPQPTETQKKSVKSEAKETTKPKSDSTVKTPKPNPAKRHKSSDDLDISDAGPQRTEQREKAQQPHDKDAAERKFKEVMERTGTKPAKTSGGRLRNPPKPPTPIEQPQPSTSKQQSDVESDQISDIEEKDSISDHGEGDPYEGFKGDLKEMFNHGADTDESQWPAPDDVRERLPDEQPDDPVDTLIRTVRVHVEVVRSIENARKNGVDIYQSLVRELSNNIQKGKSKSTKTKSTKPAKKKEPKSSEPTSSSEEETEDDDDDDDFQTPGNGSPKDDDDDDDENGKPPPPSNPAPQQQGEPEIPDRQPEEKDGSDKAEESKRNEDDGGVYIPRQYGKRIPITPDTDERPLLSEWNEDTMEVLPDDIPPLTNVRVKYTGIKSASKPKPSVSEYDAGWMYTFAALKALATRGPKFATPRIAFKLLQHWRVDETGDWRQLSQNNVRHYCDLGYHAGKIIPAEPQLVDLKYKPKPDVVAGRKKYSLEDELEFVLSKALYQQRFATNTDKVQGGQRFIALNPSTHRHGHLPKERSTSAQSTELTDSHQASRPESTEAPTRE